MLRVGAPVRACISGAFSFAWHCRLRCRLTDGFSPFTASQGGPLAQPPLAIPRGTRLRGPSGSLRCSAWRGTAELVAALLRHAATLFSDKSALLARVNGTKSGCALHHWSTLQVLIAPTLCVGVPTRTLCVRARLLRCARFRVSRKRRLLRLFPAHAARQSAHPYTRGCAECCRYAHPAPVRSIRRCLGCLIAWVRCRAS